MLQRKMGFFPLLILLAPTSNAAWLEASTDHFVIYVDEQEKALAGFAERLELFDAAMAQVFQTPHPRSSPSNRVKIFVVSNAAQVRQINEAGKYVVGLYKPRAGSTVAFVPRLTSGSSQYEMSARTVLYHEYALHFMSSMTATYKKATDLGPPAGGGVRNPGHARVQPSSGRECPAGAEAAGGSTVEDGRRRSKTGRVTQPSGATQLIGPGLQLS
jgi:hypothetical protein